MDDSKRPNHKQREHAHRKAIEYLTRAAYALVEPAPDSAAAALVYTGQAMLEIIRWCGPQGCEDALAYLRETTTREA